MNSYTVEVQAGGRGKARQGGRQEGVARRAGSPSAAVSLAHDSPPSIIITRTTTSYGRWQRQNNRKTSRSGNERRRGEVNGVEGGQREEREEKPLN